MAGPPNKPPTERQNKARQRAWRIFRLRGLHAQAHMLTGENREKAIAAIDHELLEIGAQSESARQYQRRNEP